MNELEIPRSIGSDKNAIEMVRVWISDEKQHVSLNAPGWEDPAAWGLLLVDVARFVADAYHQAEGLKVEEVLARIKAGFDAEWEGPTDEAKGGFVE